MLVIGPVAEGDIRGMNMLHLCNVPRLNQDDHSRGGLKHGLTSAQSARTDPAGLSVS